MVERLKKTTTNKLHTNQTPSDVVDLSYNTLADQFATATQKQFPVQTGRDSVMIRKTTKKKAKPKKVVGAVQPRQPSKAEDGAQQNENLPEHKMPMALEPVTECLVTTQLERANQAVQLMREEREALLAENAELRALNSQFEAEAQRMQLEAEKAGLDGGDISSEREKRRESIFNYPGDERAIGEHEAMVELYSALTGVTLTPASDNSWECLFSSPSGDFGFRLQVEPRTEKIHYTPHLTRSLADDVATLLPGYLREKLVFGIEQLPKFFARLFPSLSSLKSGSR